MKGIGNLDENMLWQTCFPHTWMHCGAQGIYTVRDGESLLQEAKSGALPEEPIARSVFRLELACAMLWPRVKDLFLCDFFPHLLACATDLLRAADFGEEKDEVTCRLVQEVISALDGLERLLAAAEEAEEALVAEPEKDKPQSETEA